MVQVVKILDAMLMAPVKMAASCLTLVKPKLTLIAELFAKLWMAASISHLTRMLDSALLIPLAQIFQLIIAKSASLVKLIARIHYAIGLHCMKV